MKITIGLADDHQLLLKSLGGLINGFSEFEVIVEALNGMELLEKIRAMTTAPEIVLVDVNMPVLDGVGTTEKLCAEFPGIKPVALSMKDDDSTIIAMLRAGCCAYLLKDIHPAELEKALREVYDTGAYNADAANLNYRRLILSANESAAIRLSNRELEFLKLACSDLTYKQIAAQMALAERTIDGYRESIFEKLNVQSRVGMALEAIRRNLVSL